MSDISTTIFALIPLIILAFVFRWIRQIKNAMALQIHQNEEIIALLKKISSDK